MGLGGWIASKVDAVGDAVEEAWDDQVTLVGSGVEALSRLAEQRLDEVGLVTAADWVRTHGDQLADRLGAQVGERDLGETDDPAQLVHGVPDSLQDRVSSLTELGDSFGDVADGLGRIETGRWAGDGAEAFASTWRTTPGDWRAAQDACHRAASALAGYIGTVRWAQRQAAEAVRQWNAAAGRQSAALAAHRTAVRSYNRAVDDYNADLATGASPGLPPVKPAPFHDPGPALFAAAQELLADARRQRNDAAEHAAAAIRAATATAPALPSFHDRLGMDLLDLSQLHQFQQVHFAGGFVEGTADLVHTVRALSPNDPANSSHPEEYDARLAETADSLGSSVTHPRELLRGLVGSGWSTDPAGAAGRLTPSLLLGLVSGGTGTAAEAGGSLGLRLGVRGLGRRATEIAEDATKTAEHARPAHVRVHCKDPVDVATGAVVLDQTDLELPGALPLVLRRRHLSSWAYGHWFGPTWSSTFDERIDVGDDHVVVVRADACAIVFPRPRRSAEVSPTAGERGLLRRADNGGFTLTDPMTGWTRCYAPPVGGRSLLETITDADGHRVEFVRDAVGTPVEVRHSAGYRVLVEAADGRITGLAVVREDGEAERVASYEYAHGHLVAVVDESGEPLRLTYDAAGRLTSWTDRNGMVFGYAYDARGRCADQAGTDGVMASRFTYTDLGDGWRETAVTDSRGTTRFVVDDRLRIVGEVDALGHETRKVWDGDRLVAITDPLGRTAAYEYDEDGNLVALIRPDGSRQTIAWATFGGRSCPVGATLADGTVWTFSYDQQGRRTAMTDPVGATTRYAYDARGHLASVTDATGATRTIESDAAGLPVVVTEPDGATTRLDREALGRVVAVTDALGARTELTWTRSGRLVSRIFADGSVERWSYDAEGNPVEHVDAAGRVTRTAYTHFDLPAEVTAPDGGVTRFAYDPELRLVAVTGPHGRTWRYEYDAAGRLVEETDLNGRTLRFGYDAAGQLVRRVNGAGECVETTHDLLGNVVWQRAGDAVTTFAYDPLGRLLRATGPVVELALERDPLGRVVAESVDGRTVSSSYDLLGRRISRITPTGLETTWTFGASRLPERVVVGGHEIGFLRDACGRETRRQVGAAVLEQTWDMLGQLVRQTLGAVVGAAQEATGATLSVRQQRDYTYSAGRLVGVADRLCGARRFELDLADRILAVDGDVAEVYAYDPMGNIVRAAVGGAEVGGTEVGGGDVERREYDGTLLLRAGRTRSSYDGQGRLVRRVRTRVSRKPEVWAYQWDAEDRLVGLRTPDGVWWRYLYDALGRRVAKRRLDRDGHVAEEVLFAWDGPTLVEETTAAGSRAWVHEGLAPVAQVERSTDDDVDARFYAIVADLVGAPAELVTADGELVWHARRALWGAPRTPDADPVPLRFPGQYADPESGLFYNLHRYYDPDTARYLSQDPLGLAPAPNPNAYVANPTVLADPLGLFSCRDAVDLVGARRRRHILDGEVRPNGTYGGGHRHGTGFPQKSEFPETWSDAKIIHEISDIATDPALGWRPGSRPGDFWVSGTREGVDIEVLIRRNQIWTAYPTNVPKNP
ncbi:putative T7SS-secreted protein [Nocardioides sp. DS6]|uniref:T7SS-secreted protein n=1 Tax=Nocardioides eburneus TaxID=3231482 RepID=A0ABV3SVB7_9ACTN